ncbi:MAG TPA: DNA-processing protein DprA [Trebonia sp.]|nr:DNA-processing protein DprA [Trebonia sp.]
MTGRLDEESYARAALTYLAEPGDLQLGALVRGHGAAPMLAAIKAGTVPDFLDSGAARAAARRAMRCWQVRLTELPSADDIAGLCRAGIRLACPGDPEWPARLDDLGAAMPYALWLRGSADLRFSCVRSVAIVGARAATAYGSYVASEFAASVAERGWTVVSGGAYGVDAAAHRGALAADGVTVAVLACGVDVPYPAGHADLLDAIAAQGVVVSEWPPGRNATRLRFLVRNRTIAALAAGTVVVEAASRSGALNSARHARDLGRPLMAVPGPITSELSAGCHTVIREWQGMLVTSAADVIEYLSPLGSAAGDPSASPSASPAAGPGTGPGTDAGALLGRDALDLEAAAVLDALPSRGGMGSLKIASRAGLDPDTVLRCLGALAAVGFAERCDQGWRLRRS